MTSSQMRMARVPILPFATSTGVPLVVFARNVVSTRGLTVRGSPDGVLPFGPSGRELDRGSRSLFRKVDIRPPPESGSDHRPPPEPGATLAQGNGLLSSHRQLRGAMTEGRRKEASTRCVRETRAGDAWRITESEC
jgi:hypothetical protein